MAIESEDVDVRSGTTAEWAASTLVPGKGELCVDTDTAEIRVGDGTNVYTSLAGRSGPFKRGVATLVGGTVTVTGLTGVVAADLAFVACKTLGTVTVASAYKATPGTGTLVITASAGTDTSVVSYVVFKA